MMNRKGMTKFVEYIIAIIIIIPVLLVILYILIFGVGSIKQQVQSVSAYVTQTMTALTTGTSVLLPGLSPVLGSGDFMGQFYGSPACISLLDQLSRAGKLVSPNNPATMAGQFFMCVGSYGDFSTPSAGKDDWSNLPAVSDNASFPNWFPAYQELNSKNSPNSSGLNGSLGTLSFFEDIGNASAALSSLCVSFFNASVVINGVNYGYGIPSAYINSLSCTPYSNNGKPIFISVTPFGGCGSGCSNNPFGLLHGNNVGFNLQTCSYVPNSPALTCQESVS